MSMIDSFPAFREAVLERIEAAVIGDARSMVWLDLDFTEWPLDDPRLVAALGPWLRRPCRRVTLAALDFGAVPRRFPQFTAWRRSWAHALPGRQLHDADPERLMSMLWCDDGGWLRLLGRDPCRARQGMDGRGAAEVHGAIDVFLQRSSDGFSPVVLGL